KLRCQVVAFLAHETRTYKVSPLCELLGITRQGFYKHVDKISEECILITSIVLYCQHIRAPDNLPKAGCRELLELIRQ
ncbi:IS3 family transposase, partial [bacterium]|nr:IS3 family transposase [bacterium]